LDAVAENWCDGMLKRCDLSDVNAIWRIPFALLLVASIFCSDGPQNHWVASTMICLSWAMLAVLWIRRPVLNFNLIAYGFGLFMLAIAISFPVALHFGTSAFDWAFRGAAPLAFLSTFFFLPIKSDQDVTFVQDTTLVACGIWAAWIILQLAPNYAVLPFERWTGHSSDLLIPFNLVGIALVLFRRQPINWASGILLFVLLVLTVGAGYRSHFTIVALMLIGGSIYKALIRDYRWIATVSILTTLALVPFGTLAIMDLKQPGAAPKIQAPVNQPPPSDGQLPLTDQEAPPPIDQRAPNDIAIGVAVGDEGRALESRFALQQFLESPLFGKGLSYPISSEFIFRGQEAYRAELERKHGKVYSHVYYVHNFIVYIAMTMGLLGLSAIALIIVGCWKAAFARRNNVAAGVAITTLLVFSIVAATFTLPQFNILIASLAALLARPVKTRLADEPSIRATELH
jgi:hypothetical protein